MEMNVEKYTEWEYGKGPEDDDELDAIPSKYGGTRRVDRICNNRHPATTGGNYQCTRTLDHKEDHVAYGGSIVARWPNKNETPSHGRYAHELCDTCGAQKIVWPGAAASVICPNCQTWRS